jgi:hypothetical protein
MTKKKDPGDPEHENVTKLRTGGKTRKAASRKKTAARKPARRKAAAKKR